ncbi:glycerol-3-phosphate responsive antiterminator [Cohnella nanjingensis]|uniref:Glycerol uptake operon antiterminator regulatory protein n=1 Tax=Cohnella nanjingensis TaxID=1387779 RepID=A0A7X0RUR0_9BACL|nr:glycerol-3-phosphate responsive antiterminator [Cohnella nanjingensis]MBB6674058.1 glycerol-3-phosphate responsive antiterminator [Cohnella nanjingensis]
MTLLHRLAQSPVIAAIRSEDALENALASEAANLFIMGGALGELSHMVQAAKARDKGAFIHLDLIRGLSSTDKESLAFLREQIGADGIITPKSHLIKEAKRIGLYAIYHLFILDSHALSSGLALARSLHPDAVEIMPGAIPKVIGRLAEELEIPVVASGLIQTKEEAVQALNAGATALSVSEQALWGLTFGDL